MLSTPSKNGSPKNADSGSSNAAHSTIPPRLVLSAAAFSNSSSNALRLFGATSGKNGSSIGCSHMHGSNRKSDMFPIRRTCEKTRIPCSRRSCFAIAPAKTSGAVSRPENAPPPRGSLYRRISDLLHNPHGTDVQRYRSNPWILHQNCGKRRSAAFP